MLQAKVLGNPLPQGGLAGAGQPKKDRTQESGSHCLRKEWGGQMGNRDKWASSLREAPGALFLLPLPLTPSVVRGLPK